jgi:hypothetical protein
MKAIRASLAVTIAKLLGVPVKVREDFHRPEWLVSPNVAGQPIGSCGSSVQR